MIGFQWYKTYGCHTITLPLYRIHTLTGNVNIYVTNVINVHATSIVYYLYKSWIVFKPFRTIIMIIYQCVMWKWLLANTEIWIRANFPNDFSLLYEPEWILITFIFQLVILIFLQRYTPISENLRICLAYSYLFGVPG